MNLRLGNVPANRLLLGGMLVWIGLAGCDRAATDNGYEKAEHFVPLHWPSDLIDAAAKIDQRASQLLGPTTPETAAIESQLRDIVGWVPEIAADTDLTEQQWNPVYFASESLSKKLAKLPRPLDETTHGLIREFCNLLITTHEWLPPDDPGDGQGNDPSDEGDEVDSAAAGETQASLTEQAP